MEYDEDIYERDFVDELLDNDEIDDWEAGFMMGIDEDFEE